MQIPPPYGSKLHILRTNYHLINQRKLLENFSEKKNLFLFLKDQIGNSSEIADRSVTSDIPGLPSWENVRSAPACHVTGETTRTRREGGAKAKETRSLTHVTDTVTPVIARGQS